MTNESSRRFKTATLILTLATTLFFTGINSYGQEEENTKNNKDQTKRSDAKVNPTSLGMELSIPLGGAPGRAGNSLPITFNYSSKVWRTEVFTATEDGHNVYWANPIYGEDSYSGWTTNLQPLRTEDTSIYYPSPASLQCGTNYQVIRKITVHFGDGSTVELAATLTPVTATKCQETLPTTYYSFDGSNLKYVINGSASTLYMPNGSRYEWNANGLEHIDRNGNRNVYQASQKQWTDTMGRTIPVPEAPLNSSSQMIEGDVDYYAPTMPGKTMKWTFKWKKLQYSFGNLNGTYSIKQLEQLFTIVYPQIELQSHNPVVLNELVQPDGRSYKFYYNEYGEIEKIEYPTGSTEKFTHSQFGPFSFGGRGALLVRQGNRGVANRVVSMDSNPANDLIWTYDIPTNSTTKAAILPYTVKTTNPDGTRTERLLHISEGQSGTGPPVLPSIMGGKEYESKVYDSTNTLKRRELTKWSGSSYSGASWINAYAKVDKKTSIMIEGTSALAQNTTLSYSTDNYLNVTRQTVFDFTVPTLTTAQTGNIDSFSNGTALKTSETTYITDSNYINKQMVSMPSLTTVKTGDENGSVVAKSETAYDEAAYAPIFAGTNAQWQDPGTVYRGNATATRTWYSEENRWIETHTQFDNFGNIRKVWDSSDDPTRFVEVEYSPTYHYAYPTKTKAPAPDPTGIHGMTEDSEISRVYDFNTGLLTSVTDANGQTATTEYDALLRPIRVNPPAGGSVSETVYDDTPGNLWVKRRQQTDEYNWAESTTYFDNLGRALKSRTKDLQGDVVSEIRYDNFGRLKATSNPYRVDASGNATEPVYWSKPRYDELNRLVETLRQRLSIQIVLLTGRAWERCSSEYRPSLI